MKRTVTAIWALLTTAIFFMVGVQIADRFVGNGTAWSFYSVTIDATCIVSKDNGKNSMYCFPGERRAQTQGGRDE